MTEEQTDWIAIGKRLNRVPSDCNFTWKNIQARAMKKGPFDAAEDAIIRQKVAEWGNKGEGLWLSLTKELGRSRKDAHIIRRRWERVLEPQAKLDRGAPKTDWSAELVGEYVW